MTGRSSHEEQALYGGAYAYLEKPLDLEHFLSVVHVSLERSRLEHRLRSRNLASRLNLMDSVDSSEQLA